MSFTYINKNIKSCAEIKPESEYVKNVQNIVDIPYTAGKDVFFVSMEHLAKTMLHYRSCVLVADEITLLLSNTCRNVASDLIMLCDI